MKEVKNVEYIDSWWDELITRLQSMSDVVVASDIKRSLNIIRSKWIRKNEI